jgi:hypothetical protein
MAVTAAMSTLFDLDSVPGITDPATGKSDPGTAAPAPPGQNEPRNGQLSPRVAGDGLWAFDWSITRNVAAVDPNGGSHRFRELDELIRYLPAGATLVGESTFHSYDLRCREETIRLAEARGINLLTVPARGNRRRREAAGWDEKTSQSKRIDIEDALGIQLAARSGAHLKKPAPPDEAWAELRKQARKRFVYLRFSGQKDRYALELARHLPPLRLEPVTRMVALGKFENSILAGYNLIIVAAAGVAAEFTSSREDFERLTGLYSHGYPCQFRSDFMHWGWAKQPKKRERISLSAYRRELRWLFRQLSTSASNC